MTNDSVRDGASPRGPKTGSPDPAPPQQPAWPSPAATDWLAPVEPAPPSDNDWLVPASPVQPPAEFEPELEPADEADEFGSEDEFAPEDPFADDSLADDEGEPDAAQPELSILQRLRRISPAVVLLGLAAVASLGLLLAQLVSHTAPISVLTSVAVVTGMIYAAITIVSGVASYHAATAGRGRLSYLLAFIGGSAAVVACGSFAGATLLVLALGF